MYYKYLFEIGFDFLIILLFDFGWFLFELRGKKKFNIDDYFKSEYI